MPHTGLPIIGEQTFAIEGEVHQLVTFLNKMLKDRDLIFGLSREEGRYWITVYDSAPQVLNSPSIQEGE